MSIQMPETYNKDVWNNEIEGVKWYVEWQSKGCDQCGTEGQRRLNYFPTLGAAHAFIAERQKAKDYTWYKEPGKEVEVK